ncbi:hypothetical protein STCU_10524 [Strigomonas culicis]|uniref:Uncharacterized protein n=1 Tax=Strigomonas culicis TaxID=28005 RepID=S9THV6_9TRYP|nr:hypothetical protein STCU_10524 [Strigomonas culicis]|eukprot:EPY17602.1 hypothetical protein STCU_10524 [Strigomonas culicis]
MNTVSTTRGASTSPLPSPAAAVGISTAFPVPPYGTVVAGGGGYAEASGGGMHPATSSHQHHQQHHLFNGSGNGAKSTPAAGVGVGMTGVALPMPLERSLSSSGSSSGSLPHSHLMQPLPHSHTHRHAAGASVTAGAGLRDGGAASDSGSDRDGGDGRRGGVAGGVRALFSKAQRGARALLDVGGQLRAVYQASRPPQQRREDYQLTLLRTALFVNSVVLFVVLDARSRRALADTAAPGS